MLLWTDTRNLFGIFSYVLICLCMPDLFFLHFNVFLQNTPFSSLIISCIIYYGLHRKKKKSVIDQHWDCFIAYALLDQLISVLYVIFFCSSQNVSFREFIRKYHHSDIHFKLEKLTFLSRPSSLKSFRVTFTIYMMWKCRLCFFI